MKAELISNNISLDTSFIEGQNFLAGSKMRDLSTLCIDGSIKLFITDITYRETIARFRTNAAQAIEKIKKPKSQIEGNARLLRNFPELKMFFELPSPDIEDLCEKFLVMFDKWLRKNKTTIIPTDNLSIKDILDDYFYNRPPFKEGEKKHEFPDAFTLKATEEFFKKKAQKTYILTIDKDLLSYKSEIVIPIDDSASLFDLIIRSLSEKRLDSEAIKLIESELFKSKYLLSIQASALIKKAIEDEVGSTNQIDQIEIEFFEDVKLSEIEFGQYSIVNLNNKKGTAIIECEINFSFDVRFSAKDYSEAWHDNEDDVWHYLEEKSYSIDDTFYIPISITAAFNIQDGFIEMEVDNINNGYPLEIFESFRPWQV